MRFTATAHISTVRKRVKDDVRNSRTTLNSAAEFHTAQQPAWLQEVEGPEIGLRISLVCFRG